MSVNEEKLAFLVGEESLQRELHDYGKIHLTDMIPVCSDAFDRKLRFSAVQSLAARRSLRTVSPAGSIPPPVDLSGPGRDGGLHRGPRPRSYGDTDGPRGREVSAVLHVKRVVAEVLGGETPSRRETRRFITSYRPPDPLQEELMFVKLGKFPPEGPYRNPRPHDFRPVRRICVLV